MQTERMVVSSLHRLPPEQQLAVLDFVASVEARAYPKNALRPYGPRAGEFHAPKDFDAPLPDTKLSLFDEHILVHPLKPMPG